MTQSPSFAAVAHGQMEPSRWDELEIRLASDLSSHVLDLEIFAAIHPPERDFNQLRGTKVLLPKEKWQAKSPPRPPIDLYPIQQRPPMAEVHAKRLARANHEGG